MCVLLFYIMQLYLGNGWWRIERVDLEDLKEHYCCGSDVTTNVAIAYAQSILCIYTQAAPLLNDSVVFIKPQRLIETTLCLILKMPFSSENE